MLRFSYSPQAPSFKKCLRKLAADFDRYQKQIAQFPFTQLPWQNQTALAKIKPSPHYETIVIAGIGGSSLGAKTIITSLGNAKIQILFIDNVDPDFVASKLQKCNLKRTLFLLISKSGETIEVLSLAAIFYSRVKSAKHFLIITDNSKSSLGRFGAARSIPSIKSPAEIPGRFSALSVVGLLPAALTGIKIEKIIDGARNASARSAFTLACHQYLHYMQKKNIAVIFPYGERLNDAADWYIQLLSESIGKSKRVGITPLKATGVKDQHSQLQLFLDGPDDKFFIFIKGQNSERDHNIPGKKYTLQKLFDAEYHGVIEAFKKRKKPFVEISFPHLSAEIIGELLFFLELEIAFLGSLFKINIQNQPAVELSKKAARLILSR